MTTNFNDVWVNGTPIYDRMPGVNEGYKNDVTRWLTSFFDQEVIELNQFLDNFDEQLNPETCEPKYLDLIAALCGWSGEYWETAWAEETKRNLLKRSFDFIWPQKGSGLVLNYVISCFGIENIVREKGAFVLGVSKVGDELGFSPYEYEIILPEKYFRSPEEKLVRRLDRLFGPVWCDREIIFDNQFFKKFELIGTPISESEFSVTDVGNGDDPEILAA